MAVIFKESSLHITNADVEASIISEHYFTAADGAYQSGRGRDYSEAEWAAIRGQLALLTFCVLILKNGFTVTGEAACVSPENFNAELGRKIAREKAIEKILPLMKTKLYEAPVNEKPIGGPLILCHGCEGDLRLCLRLGGQMYFLSRLEFVILVFIFGLICGSLLTSFFIYH